MSPITPFLWFDSNASEAVDFYLSVFPNSRRLDRLDSPIQTSAPPGKVLLVQFELNGQRFTALNGGPGHPFNDAVSFFVSCIDQAEIDFYWDKFISSGGSEGRCGWLKDQFGLSWQIVPANIGKLISNPGGMQAMMKMKKLDIAELERSATP